MFLFQQTFPRHVVSGLYTPHCSSCHRHNLCCWHRTRTFLPLAVFCPRVEIKRFYWLRKLWSWLIPECTIIKHEKKKKINPLWYSIARMYAILKRFSRGLHTLHSLSEPTISFYWIRLCGFIRARCSDAVRVTSHSSSLTQINIKNGSYSSSNWLMISHTFTANLSCRLLYRLV